MAKKRNNSKLIVVILVLIVSLLGLLYLNMNSDNEKIIDEPRYMVIGKENVFVIYEDKLSLNIPFGIQVNNDKTIGDLDKAKDYQGIMDEINRMLPEEVTNYEVAKKGKIRINVAYKYDVPEVMIEEKRYVLTSSLNSLFMNKYYKFNDKNAEDVIIDVLNGNGKSGYAGKTGKRITEELSYKYNAANYERNTEYSYIINKDLKPSQVEELIMMLDEKYIKIKSELDLPTLANAVVILGKEENLETKINIHGNGEKADKAKDLLKKGGYRNLNIGDEIGSLDVIKYSAIDYYIAYKISRKLGITNMIEDSNMAKNEINIYIKN